MRLVENHDLAVRRIDELDLTVDPTLSQASAHGRTATLTMQQTVLMMALCDAYPRGVIKADMNEAIGRDRDDDTDAVQAQMSRLRNRVAGIVGIRTIHGVGHALEPIEEDS